MQAFEFLRMAMESKSTALFLIFGGLAILLTIVLVAFILSWNSRKAKEAGYAASLKAQMIERGMSVEEIERVIRAGNAVEADEDGTTIEARVVSTLGNHCYGSSDISQIVDALRRHDGAPDAEQRKQSDYVLIRTMAGQWMEANDIVRLLEERRTKKVNA